MGGVGGGVGRVEAAWQAQIRVGMSRVYGWGGSPGYAALEGSCRCNVLFFCFLQCFHHKLALEKNHEGSWCPTWTEVHCASSGGVAGKGRFILDSCVASEFRKWFSCLGIRETRNKYIYIYIYVEVP